MYSKDATVLGVLLLCSHTLPFCSSVLRLLGDEDTINIKNKKSMGTEDIFK